MEFKVGDYINFRGRWSPSNGKTILARTTSPAIHDTSGLNTVRYFVDYIHPSGAVYTGFCVYDEDNLSPADPAQVLEAKLLGLL